MMNDKIENTKFEPFDDGELEGELADCEMLTVRDLRNVRGVASRFNVGDRVALVQRVTVGGEVGEVGQPYVVGSLQSGGNFLVAQHADETPAFGSNLLSVSLFKVVSAC